MPTTSTRLLPNVFLKIGYSNMEKKLENFGSKHVRSWSDGENAEGAIINLLQLRHSERGSKEPRAGQNGGDRRGPPLPRTMEELVIPQFYQTLDDGTLFLQFDKGAQARKNRTSK
jgi:hypothetical protein